ncbi:Ran-specific GTPase-activating protein [Tupaia chinensis]|uniref:Ran-specific GTPase-activating protein n=1 Tax=Tupaia chinensis TaxID=246437 RepID=L9KY25_TUPCH|nr:Ran-specific GTPase-activating protein [Tupaia chinensis]
MCDFEDLINQVVFERSSGRTRQRPRLGLEHPRRRVHQAELLAIRFLNAEKAQKFKTKFEECRKEIEEREKKGPGQNDNAEKEAEKLEAPPVKETKEPEDQTKEEAEEKQ